MNTETISKTQAFEAIKIAKRFLELAKNEGLTLTNMQVQKLVYFSHGYALAIDEPLINQAVKAWNFGPVIPEMYNKLKKFGNEPILLEQLSIDDANLTDNQNTIINWVWNNFKTHSGSELSRISHQTDAPWYKIWSTDRFGEIPNSLTKDYYLPFVQKQ